MLLANSGRALLASSADTTHRMSIGNPAARRVTDVERGDCRTCNPYSERGGGGNISVNLSPASDFTHGLYIAGERVTSHLFQHAGRDIP